MYCVLNVLVCVIDFILFFFPLCSVLVYHGYANANIDSWSVRTRFKIPPTSKHFNNSNSSTIYSPCIYGFKRTTKKSNMNKNLLIKCLLDK